MSTIIQVVVVGFHHTKGYQVEYAYPPFPGSDGQGEPIVPQEWENLPHLAMPDGSHNASNGDVVYFVLPSLENRRCTVFGIACYQQIDASSLLTKDADVTRSHVQKSVCVISRVPLYGNLRAKLELITRAYFNERDFSKVQILQQMYASLNDLFAGDCLDDQAIYMGLPLSPLLKSFRHRVLELFKLVLLEKKVIFELTPTSRLSDVFMGLMSLFPSLLEDGLFEAAGCSSADEDATRSDPAKPVISMNNYGFPLHIFVKGNLFHPYMSINGIEGLRSDKVRAYCVGVTNSVFKHNKDLYDVYVTLDATDSGVITYNDLQLERTLSLTTQDLRFMQTVITEVENSDAADFVGNNDWVRVQFCSYLSSLFQVSRGLNPDAVPEFGTEFQKAWTDTYNYRVWSTSDCESIPNVKPSHPCSGPPNANDLLIFVNRRFNKNGQSKKVINTISNTAKYVTEQGSRLRSTFSSWIVRPSSSQNLNLEGNSKQ